MGDIWASAALSLFVTVGGSVDYSARAVQTCIRPVDRASRPLASMAAFRNWRTLHACEEKGSKAENIDSSHA
jgi:hypothetical protein